jgi:predicted acylesterase/phospholipase RssA
MRGIYTATYLDALERAFVKRRGHPNGLDIGNAFKLIVGTSTGAIIGCGLAKGVTPATMVNLYKLHGPKIFRRKLPSRPSWDFLTQLFTRRENLKLGNEALKEALTDIFGTMTISQLWKERRIALAVPAVNMGTYRSWVFKTPHVPKTDFRDDDYTLVDVCLATSAAPLFRSLAFIQRPAGNGSDVFVDGGLWANNPVLVALLEALRMSAGQDDDIEIFTLGTCGKPEGEVISADQVHRGLFDWKLGAEAAKIAIAAQEFAFDSMARLLVQHVKRRVRVVRFPVDKLPGAMLQYLDLDETRRQGLDALMNQARHDADMTNSIIQQGSDDGTAIEALFNAMPPRTRQEVSRV